MNAGRWAPAAAAYADAHPAAVAVTAAVVLAAGFAGWRAARRLGAGARKVLRGQQAEDVLTLVAAAVATTVAMTGMWRFFGVVLGFSGLLRALLFAFIEVSTVTSAFRARRTMRQFGNAGIDGAAVWGLTGLSAVLSSLDARSAAEAVFRLAAPLVAAWLWERGLSLERRRATGRVIHWRVSAERVLVWLRLADPAERAASDVDAHRRIARLARAAKRLGGQRTAAAAAWRQRLAKRRLDAATAAAVAHAGLASDPARQDDLRDQLGALLGAEALASLNPAAPWERRMQEDRAAGQVAEARQEAEALVEAARAARDRAVGEAVTAAAGAEDRAQAAAADANRARAETHELHGTVTAAIRALDETRSQAVTAARAREEQAAAEVAGARRQAEALIQAALADRDRAVAEAGQLRGTVAAAARALEEARTDLRDRTERAERELADARMRADELAEALARAERPAARTGPGEVDRAAVVSKIADQIRDAVEAGERWQPDSAWYAVLMAETGYKRRWCERVVKEARDQIFDPPPDPESADGPATSAVTPGSDRADDAPARADSRADEPDAGSRTGAGGARTGTAPGGEDARTQAQPRNGKPATRTQAEARNGKPVATAPAGGRAEEAGDGLDGASGPRGQPGALTAVDRAAS